MNAVDFFQEQHLPQQAGRPRRADGDIGVPVGGL
jgi:hypothetical protein